MSGAPLNKKKIISLISSTPRHFNEEISGPCLPHYGGVCNFSSREELLEPMNQLPGPLIFQPVIAGGAHWALKWSSYMGYLPGLNVLQYFNVRLEVITLFTNCIFKLL